MTKKISYAVLMAGMLLISCGKKNQEDNNAAAPVAQGDQKLKPIADSLKVDWTAYKTTDKVPVKGHFTSIKLEKVSEGNSIEDIMNSAEFSINSMELATGNDGRDEKLKKSFFGLMDEPGVIKGKLNFNDNQWTVSLTMNGVTVDNVPAQVEIKDQKFTLNTTIKLEDFKAIKVLNALNEICHDLHKGPDGISKTWDVVDVSATEVFEGVE
ncbi:YceI-like domain-containing protein [Riemerella columbipharyngis]|uniref:YceI-like domain-containing protein n=2 Tax=Riemerella columbipharyngis TaxID=1071918 RepID=A0A1G6YFB4_9FLAO|nr:YceI-like domain-containing protein [Riemerella columbipharyngis]